MKKTTLLMGALAACILSTHQVQAALYNVQFGGNTAQGGAYEAPLQTGAGIVGTAGDTWNYVNTVGLATLTSATGINLNDSSNVGSTVFLKVLGIRRICTFRPIYLRSG